MSNPSYWILPLSYLLGSIPVGWLVARIFYNTDIRQAGSGNIGATNALRQFGTKVGVFVMLLDMLKGVLAVFLAKHYYSVGHPLISLAGLFAILGHIYPLWLRFKGGKGVATAAGVFGALAPLSLLIALFVFVVTVWRSRYVSLGSIIAALIFGISTSIFQFSSPTTNWALLLLVWPIVTMIIIKHKSNINRLFKGEENRISFSKKGKS